MNHLKVTNSQVRWLDANNAVVGASTIGLLINHWPEVILFDSFGLNVFGRFAKDMIERVGENRGVVNGEITAVTYRYQTMTLKILND